MRFTPAQALKPVNNPGAQSLMRSVSEILEASLWFMRVLGAVAHVAPPEWVVGGGVIRSLVWDRLHGYSEPTPLNDVDVAYFDPSDLREEREHEYAQQLSRRLRNVPWDVKNQAAVHLWYARVHGHDIAPVTSITDAVSRFPETATSVAVRLGSSGALEVIAPCGLDDLLAMKLRRNPAQVTEDYFRNRVESKRVAKKWPKVRVIYV